VRGRRPARPPREVPQELVEVDVHAIAAGGDGVGRAGELVVFAPRTAPGDRARLRIARQPRFARGVLDELLVAGPGRTEPPCAHYVHDRCGGCQLQHLEYGAQLEAKRSIIEDTLRRIGRRAVEVAAVRASDRPWRYRRKLTLALRRTTQGWIAGLHPYDVPSRIFALRDCPITDERVLAVWKQVLAAERHFPDVEMLRMSVRLLDAGAAVSVEGGTSWRRAQELFEAVPSAVELWWAPDEARRRLLHRRKPAALSGGAPHDAGASFTQVNAGVTELLRAHVFATLEVRQGDVAVDAYAGKGEFATFLAGRGARVTAIELDPDAASVAARRLPDGSRVLTGAVETRLPEALPANLIVVNPPRGGLDARVAALLESTTPPPRQLVYVSCDPATLARDLARMPRWRISDVTGFDMFPQTAHVETVCALVPETP